MFPNRAELHLEFELRTESGLLLTDDLQIHLLQLSNLNLTAENVRYASPIEQWAFFLLNAHDLSLEDVKRIFPDPVFTEAAGVLEMISKSPEEQMRYEARLKFQRDEAARLEQVRAEVEEQARAEVEQARAEGIREGEARGALLGRIALLRELLGTSQSDVEELSRCDEVRLSEIADQLQSQLRNRGV